MTRQHNHPSDTAFQNGLATRTQVMGQDFVDKAFDGMTAFTQPIQHHITRAAWGDTWQRGVPAAVEGFRAAAEVVDGAKG